MFGKFSYTDAKNNLPPRFTRWVRATDLYTYKYMSLIIFKCPILFCPYFLSPKLAYAFTFPDSSWHKKWEDLESLDHAYREDIIPNPNARKVKSLVPITFIHSAVYDLLINNTAAC